MGEERFKKLYDYMLENGELFQVYEDMTGNWEKDFRTFTTEQLELENIIEFKDVEETDE